MDSTFRWRDRNVLITGHSGFKGTWLTLWLHLLGARICGISLDPPSNPNLFELLHAKDLLNKNIFCDIRDFKALRKHLTEQEPEIIFHLAAQPIVRLGYLESRGTFETNMMGTVNLLEAVKDLSSLRTVVVITSDKCYRPTLKAAPYTEEDPLGGIDPYSASKACAEIVCGAYRHILLNRESNLQSSVLFTARAGNVLGGGDFGSDRLAPDCLRAYLSGETLEVRHPDFIRTWIHVLDLIHGYIALAEYGTNNNKVDNYSFNFAPGFSSSVMDIVEGLSKHLSFKFKYATNDNSFLKESEQLKLDARLAQTQLKWSAKLGLEAMLSSIAMFVNLFKQGGDLRAHCIEEISHYRNMTK